MIATFGTVVTLVVEFLVCPLRIWTGAVPADSELALESGDQLTIHTEFSVFLSRRRGAHKEHLCVFGASGQPGFSIDIKRYQHDKKGFIM